MRRIIAASVVLLAIGAGVTVALRLRPISQEFYTDADRIKVPAESAPLRDILWQPPAELPAEFNTGVDDYEPRLSADGMTLYFVRGKAGQNADIYTASRTLTGWSPPRPVTAINSDGDDLGPEPTADGEALYFYSNREGGLGGYDLWVLRRRDDGWGEPANLGPQVNSEFNDYGPAVTADESVVYFASNRPQPGDEKQPNPNAWPATLREDLFDRTYDLYAAPITDRGFGNAAYLAVLNTPFNEGAPAVTPFGDFLYFASDRPGGQGAFDLYRSWRLRGEILPPEDLGAAVNTAANELDPGLGLGGYALYFSSDRPRPSTPGSADAAAPTADPDPASVEPTNAEPPPRDYNLYQTTSREVFAETQRQDREPIDWAALWGLIGPNLLWALLALLLLLALLALYRGTRDRRLSLLAKCLLGSMAAHLLLMLLLNTWQVAASIAGEFRRGRIQVALAAPAGTGIASQILAGLTEIEPPAKPAVEAFRLTAVAEFTPPPIETPWMEQSLERRPIEFAKVAPLLLQALEAEPHPMPPPQPKSDDRDPAPAPAPPTELATRLPGESQRMEAAEFDALETAEAAPATADSRADLPREVAEPITLATTPADSRGSELGAAGSATLVQGLHVSESAPRPAAGVTVGELLPRPPENLRLELVVPAIPQGAAGEPVVEEQAAIPSPAAGVPAARAVPAATLPVGAVALARPPLERSDAVASASESFVLRQALEPSDTRPRSASIPTDDEPQRVEPAAALATSLALSLPAASAPLEDTAEVAPSAAPVMTAASRSEFKNPVEPVPLASMAETPAPIARSSASDDSRSLAAAPAAHEATIAPSARPALATDDTAAAELAASPVLDVPLGLPAASERAPRNSLEETIAMPVEAAASSAERAPMAPAALSAESSATRSAAVPPDDDAPASVPLMVQLLPTALPSSFSTVAPVRLSSTTDRQAVALSSSPVSMPELGLPTEELAPQRPLMHRLSEDRLALAKERGGNEQTEQAVERALRWLAAHQSADGRWDADGFENECGECGGVTDVVADNALTGMSLLCFLGAGHTHTRLGPYQDNVRRGLKWLLSRQADNGDLRSDETMYSHGIATIALSESLTLTADSALEDHVQRAVRFIDRSRHRSRGGWRYDPGQEGDTSVLGWQVMALKSAQMAGVDVPAAALRSARDWLKRVDSRSRPGLYSYQPGMEPTASMTAEAMFTQLLLGIEPADPRLKASAEFILDELPDWDENPNTYFWYYASLALLQRQGPAWETWNAAVSRELVEHQRKDGRAVGSWDPVGEWAKVGGRVYQTAICTLILEVYYRYLPLYSPEAATPLESLGDEVVGAIRGRVTDRATGEPIAESAVRLSLADGPSLSATSNDQGEYVLGIPQVPEHFAVSASAPGYVPSTRSVRRDDLEGDVLDVDFQLERLEEGVVVLEAEPQVHHLGDNEFDGLINSQFQKRAEGDRYETTFELSAERLQEGLNRAEVVLLAKGVQRRHRIVINGTTLDQRLEEAPDDGSFGEFVAPLSPEFLTAGTNRLEIIAAPSSSDIDDFEFINIRVRLYGGSAVPAVEDVAGP